MFAALGGRPIASRTEMGYHGGRCDEQIFEDEFRRGRMSSLYEELDHSVTVLGELSLRRRRYIGLDTDVYEVKLADDFLMSSLFTASEEALARLGVHYALDGTTGGRADTLDVVVGGLGLGYTAAAVLESSAVRSLLVVEFLKPVIDWHQRGLLPVSANLTGDPRCRIVSADFFASAFSDIGFDPETPARRFHAVLADIDHTPDSWLDPGNNAFYTVEGLRRVHDHLLPGGVFGLWSNEPPEERFRATMAGAFSREWAEPVLFHNPLQNRSVTQTVYFGAREDS